MCSPKMCFSWPADIVIDAAQIKPSDQPYFVTVFDLPVITGCDMKLTMKPSPKRPIVVKITPDRNESIIAMFGSEVSFKESVPSSTGHVRGRPQAAATSADIIAVGPTEIRQKISKNKIITKYHVTWFMCESLPNEISFEVPNKQYINGPIKAAYKPKEVGNLAIWAYAKPCGITVIPTARPAIRSL